MSFKAFGKNIRKEDYNTIKKMVKLVTLDTVDIFDLLSIRMNVQHDDVIFVFGTAAEKESEGKTCKARLVFPEIEKLSSDLGEKELRYLALKQLLEFKDALDNAEDQISEYTQMQTLETHLRKKGTQSWEGTTSAGRKIRITLDPEESTADIHLTFAELYNLRKFMEVFDVKETKIVYKPSTNRKDVAN
jgi:hypothetical protein